MAKRKKRRKRRQEKQVTTPSRTPTKVATDYKLIIPDDVYQKIHHWLNKSKNEVSGFGSLDYDEPTNTFTVKDVKLLKQTVTPTSTEIDPHAIGKMMYDMREERLGMKWHWHTHPNMGVFWSGDDMEVIRSLGQQGWILASVFNEKGEIRTAFYTTSQVNGPLGIRDHDIFHDELKTDVIRYLPKEFFAVLDEEYEATVLKEAARPPYTPPTWRGHGGWSGYEDEWPSMVEVSTDKEEPFISKTNDETRWSHEIKLSYNDFGYAEVHGKYVYNPMHDTDIKGERAIMHTILVDMDSEEINFLRRHDNGFSNLYNKLLTNQAEASVLEGGIEV